MVRLGALAIGCVLGAAGCNEVLGIALGEPIADAGPGGGVVGGEIVWAKAISGPGTVNAEDVAWVDGRVAVVGLFEDEVVFDAAADGGKLQAEGASGFLAVYEEDGTFVFARAFPEGGGYTASVAADGDGFFVGNDFEGTAMFGLPGDPGAVTLTSTGFTDGFVARYDQKGALQWVGQIGGAGSDMTLAVSWAGGGHFMVAGMFGGGMRTSDATFRGPLVDDAITVESVGFEDGFVALFGPDGSVRWVRVLGSPGGDYVTGVSWPGFVVGVFGGSMTPETSTEMLEPVGGQDIFVARYDISGVDAQAKWVRRAGVAGEFGEFVRGVRPLVGGTGLRVAGEYASGCTSESGGPQCEITFGDPARPDASLVSAGGSDVFVAAYDGDDGSVSWARSAGGPGHDDGNLSVALATTTEADSLITGRFVQTAAFGPGEPGRVDLESAGAADTFVARYDAQGTLKWARRVGGAGEEWGRGIAVSGSGAVFAVGMTSSEQCVFGPGEANETAISADSADSYIARFAP